ncbi:MAG: 50S ribosomal protein L5 [Chloroflexi bacterium]|nr:50S ribosomal protein L5 [Chloroflexota bacterium]
MQSGENAPETRKEGDSTESRPPRARQRQQKPAPEAIPAEEGSRAADKPAAKGAGGQPRRGREDGAARAAGQQRQRRERAGRPAPAPAIATAPRPFVKPRLLTRYQSEVIPVLKREFGYSNVMQVPRLKKIVLNIGLGEAIKNAGAVDAATRDMATIAGQKPVVTKSRKSIANFGLREGQPVGVTVTLRDVRMWHFLDRLTSFALPRVRDFRGVPRNSFDGRGSFTLGLADQIVFPEIDYNKIDRLRGLQVTIVTSARTDEEARRLLELLGMPFVRPAEVVARPA